MKPQHRFARLFAYEIEANKRASDSIAGVPVANRATPVYQRVLGVAAHIQIARATWLARVKNQPAPAPADWFPAQPLDKTRQMAADTDRDWNAYIAAITVETLDSLCTYTSGEGVRYRSLVDDIITHVLNHGTYHRGQIATLVTQCGGERAVTDFIAMTRDRL